MNVLDYISILLFATGVLVAGLTFSNKQKDIKSFFSAGGAVPWGIGGLSLFMGFFSAGTFVVWGAIGYTNGLVSVTIQESMCVAGLLVGLIIAPRWHRTRALTVAEYITERFGLRTQKAYSILFLFVSLFTTGAFLYPIAKIISVSTTLPFNLCVIILGLFCVLYVSLGGLWSVVITDVLQFVVLTAAVIIVVPLSLARVGGIRSFFSQVPDGFFTFSNDAFPWAFIIAFGIYNAVFIGGNWAYVQRYTTVKTDGDARKVGFLFSAMYLICPILWMLPPMIYRVVNGGLSGNEAEGAFLLMCKDVLPTGMLGMMIGGMMFATASSFNATLNISSGVFTNDIYRQLFPGTSERGLLRVARISTVVVGFVSNSVSLLIPKMGGIVNVVISIAALTGVPLYLPVIWTLFSRFQTRSSVLFTTLFCLAVNLILKIAGPGLLGVTLNRTEEMILGVSLPVITLAVFELFFRIKGRPDPLFETYRSLQETKPVSPLSGGDANRFGVKVIGIGMLTAGVMQGLLGLFVNHHRWLVTSVGLALILIGIALFILNQNHSDYDVI